VSVHRIFNVLSWVTSKCRSVGPIHLVELIQKLSIICPTASSKQPAAGNRQQAASNQQQAAKSEHHLPHSKPLAWPGGGHVTACEARHTGMPQGDTPYTLSGPSTSLQQFTGTGTQSTSFMHILPGLARTGWRRRRRRRRRELW